VCYHHLDPARGTLTGAEVHGPGAQAMVITHGDANAHWQDVKPAV
jgi:hypothetical protein